MARDHDRSRGGRRDTGQATVELALAMPLVCLLLFAVVQVAVVGRNQLAVQLAAREAARAAAVSADASAGVAAAERAVALRPLSVRVSEHGGTVTAVVAYTDPTDVPLVGALIPAIELTAAVTMALEPPSPPP